MSTSCAGYARRRGLAAEPPVRIARLTGEPELLVGVGGRPSGERVEPSPGEGYGVTQRSRHYVDVVGHNLDVDRGGAGDPGESP
jgi:hypothetical protein